VQKNGKNSVGLLELETAILECFLEKTPLSPQFFWGLRLLRQVKIMPYQCPKIVG
jgi:hypothetical protein